MCGIELLAGTESAGERGKASARAASLDVAFQPHLAADVQREGKRMSWKILMKKKPVSHPIRSGEFPWKCDSRRYHVF